MLRKVMHLVYERVSYMNQAEVVDGVRIIPYNDYYYCGSVTRSHHMSPGVQPKQKFAGTCKKCLEEAGL